MRVCDEQSSEGRLKVCHLSFEDFLEALTRCAICKAWPTRDELEASGMSVHPAARLAIAAPMVSRAPMRASTSPPIICVTMLPTEGAAMSRPFSLVL